MAYSNDATLLCHHSNTELNRIFFVNVVSLKIICEYVTKHVKFYYHEIIIKGCK